MNALASLYRGTAFGLYGIREFTRAGYEKHARHFKEGALEKDLSGRVAIVTGANSGLGKVTALELAKRGGTVHMLCRNEERGLAAQREIIAKARNDHVHLHIVDMSEKESIKSFTDTFGSARLDLIVNNAGILNSERKENSKGLEQSFATNTLGTYYLTQLLIPVLEKCPSKPARVITVASGGMYAYPLNTQDLNWEQRAFDGARAYGEQKRHQVELNEHWGKAFDSKVIHFSCMHPGWSDTPGVQTSLPKFRDSLGDRLRTQEQGADTIVWLAVSDEAITNGSGKFFFDRQPVATHLRGSFTQARAGELEKLIRLCDDTLAGGPPSN